MLQLEKSDLTTEIEKLAAQYNNERRALMPILEYVQSKYHAVSDFVQQEIARVLDIHPVEVYSVVSFYSFFNHEQKGRNIVRLCRTIVCDMAGKPEIEKAITRELGIKFGETSADLKVTLEYTNCLGLCDQGPAMLVNDEVYTKLDPEKACNILSRLK
ncbi:MAG: NAD(P)H-dependent oxidoreductase subunit E [Ignavibacteriaceae bacterium]|nr:NAD(P)H-dependent oxidoreductase subunit E [Ignavibacteriaceae bacterium]NUM69607.1 NAD(P)H-dependent oxidoreductase subunit E [Ignavibacteriaceae bacterium]